jgi:hypothetical protein
MTAKASCPTFPSGEVKAGLSMRDGVIAALLFLDTLARVVGVSMSLYFVTVEQRVALW